MECFGCITKYLNNNEKKEKTGSTFDSKVRGEKSIYQWINAKNMNGSMSRKDTEDKIRYSLLGLVTFIIVTMPIHNTQYIMGYNIMAQPCGLTMSL